MSYEVIMSNPALWCLLIFKDCVLLGFFFYTASGEKNNIIKILLFSLLSTFAILTIRLNVPLNWVLVPILLVYIVGCLVIFRFSIIRSILIVFFSVIATTVGELVCLLFLSQFNITQESFSNSSNMLALGNLIFSLVFLVIVFFIYYSRLKINFTEDISKKRRTGMLINILITLLLISPNIVFFTTSFSNVPKTIIIFNIFSIIVFFSLCTYNTYKSNELEIKKNELEYQKLYNKTLNDLIDGLRTFKHDFANTLNSIGGFLALDDMKGLKKYFSDILDDYNSINNLSSINATIINNPSIYGLIVSKLYMAEALGIRMDIDISTSLNHTPLKLYELCKVLGIFLDNAVEASSQTENKAVKLSIKLNDSKDVYIIIVENSFSGTINIAEIFKKNSSTKGKDRGLGLWEVKNITNRYKSVSLRTSVNNQVFRQELHIPADILQSAG